MELIEALQQQAMLAVVQPDDEAWVRRVFRFYSRKFATPLHLVSQLPLDDVLLAFFEEVYEDMDEEAREERMEWLLMTAEERRVDAEADKSIAARDDAFFNNLNAAVEKGEVLQLPKEEKRKLVGTEEKPLPAGMQALAARVGRMKARAAKLAGVSLPGPKPSVSPAKKALKDEPEPSVPLVLGELPEISLKFGGGNLQPVTKWDDLDPLAPPRKAKK